MLLTELNCAKLAECIDPLDSTGHPPSLFNILSGKVANSSVNVNDAVQIGQAYMQEFTNKLPEGFHDPIRSSVVTMATSKKQSNWAINTRLTQM